MEYDNFDIHVVGNPEIPNKYSVDVKAPDGGQSNNWQKLELDKTEFQDLIHYLKYLIARPEDAEEVGTEFYRFLFSDQAGNIFFASQQAAKKQGKGLRIRLRIEPPELAQLPWEYCYDEIYSTGFVSWDQSISLVRYPSEPFSEGRIISEALPVKILLTTASPSGFNQLSVEHEVKLIQNELSSLGDNVEIDLLSHATPSNLFYKVQSWKPHIFHFIGHGILYNGRGALVLEDSESDPELKIPKLLDSSQISPIFKGSSVKVVILNACHTADYGMGRKTILGIAPALMRADIPAVLAMQSAVPDYIATIFARELYSYLALGEPLDSAVNKMRIAASHIDRVYWGIPALFMRASNGIIWQKVVDDKKNEKQSINPPAISEPLEPNIRDFLDEIARNNEHIVLPTLETMGKEFLAAPLIDIFEYPTLNQWERFERRSKDGIRELIIYKSAIAHIFYNRHLILLGDTNTGKKTLLGYLALCFSNAVLFNDREWLKSKTQQGGYLFDEWLRLLKWEYKILQEDNSALVREGFWEGEPPIPIFINLPSFVEVGKDVHSSQIIDAFWGKVIDEFHFDGVGKILREKAQEGKAIFLFHGIDKLPKKERTNLWHLITLLTKSPSGKSRWIITCNTFVYENEKTPDLVAKVRKLDQLDDKQIVSLASKVYRAVQPMSHFQLDSNSVGFQKMVDREHSIVELLKDKLILDPKINFLLKVPGFLTFFIIQIIDSDDEFRRSYVRFYQDVINYLLQNWRPYQSKSHRSLDWRDTLIELRTSPDELEKLFWFIARETHDRKEFKDGVFSVEKIRGLVVKYFGSDQNADLFLKFTDSYSHILFTKSGECGEGYSFKHPVLEKYLAACHLAHTPAFHREIIDISHQTEWKELQQILQLSAKRLLSIDNDLHKVIDTAKFLLPLTEPDSKEETSWLRIWLASVIVSSIEKEEINLDPFGKELLPRLIYFLVKLLKYGCLSHFQRTEVGDSLGLLGDPRPGICSKIPEMISISNFYISKYPITNAQFRFFVDDCGYSTDKSYWSKKGSLYIRKENLNEPRYWQDPYIARDNKPVVGISWFEAEAYTNWLSELTGQQFDLPTIDQYKRISGSNEHVNLPWGDSWEDGVINSAEAQINRLVAVGCFPKGVSASGVEDVFGNIWEWCKDKDYSDDYKDWVKDSDIGHPVKLFGGSYKNQWEPQYPKYPTLTMFPSTRDMIVGFRVVKVSN